MSQPAIVDQIVIDSRRIDSAHTLFIALPGSHTDGHAFIPAALAAGAKFILASRDFAIDPKHKHKILLVPNTLDAFQAIAGSYRKTLSTKVVAIAGSYGKTMVKDLLHSFVKTTSSVAASPESFNSQIGVALSLFTINKKHQIALIEAGISKTGEMARLSKLIQPDHIVLTHIGKKHLATLGSLKIVATEMSKLALKIPLGNWILVPDDILLHPLLAHEEVVYWHRKYSELPHATTNEGKQSLLMPYKIEFPDRQCYYNNATTGFYYFLDFLNITVKAAWLLGVRSQAIQEVLDHYVVEAMRTEIWRSPTSITFINDPYCSDPQSVGKALRHLDKTAGKKRKGFVFGGMRGPQHTESCYRHVGQMIAQAKLDFLLLVGKKPFGPLVSEIVKNRQQPLIQQCDDYSRAIDQMQSWAQQEDVFLIKGEKKQSLELLMESFNDSICTNQCFINLAAIEANILTIRNKLPSNTRIMVMVKALAYGTNDIRMSQFLESCGIDILGVSYVDEGVALRRAGVKQAIFVINAAPYEASKVVKWDLEVGVSEQHIIEMLAKEAALHGKQIKVHLHVDTGMSRFGCRPNEAVELAKCIVACPSLKLEGVMTHFACSDDPQQDEFTLTQAKTLTDVIDEIRKIGIEIPWHHAANSGGVMRFHLPQFNMVRIGLAVYGLYPSEAAKSSLDLRLALSLTSRIVGINICRSGETVSYGRTYKAARPHRIAVLPIGYFDGLHRNYSGKASVVIRGEKAPMVGKICMDFMMVDVTHIPEAEIGDPVLIFGEDEHGQYLSPEELASSGDSIIHELVTCLGPRIQRIFIYEEAYQFR